LEKKEPLRTCAACRKKADKREFIKIVKVGDEISIDYLQKKNGRSVYLCKNEDCIKKAVKTRALNRAFKRQIEDKIYEELVSFEKPSQD